MDPMEIAILGDLCVPDGMAEYFQTEFVDQYEQTITADPSPPAAAHDWGGDDGMLLTDDDLRLLTDPLPVVSTTTTTTTSGTIKKRSRDNAILPAASPCMIPPPVFATSVLPNSSMETFVDSGGVVTDDMLYELQQRSITLGNLLIQSVLRHGEGGVTMKRTRVTAL